MIRIKSLGARYRRGGLAFTSDGWTVVERPDDLSPEHTVALLGDRELTIEVGEPAAEGEDGEIAWTPLPEKAREGHLESAERAIAAAAKPAKGK